MDMNTLPKILEDMILVFKAQMDHTEQMGKSLAKIKAIDYKIVGVAGGMSKSTIFKPEKMNNVFYCYRPGIQHPMSFRSSCEWSLKMSIRPKEGSSIIHWRSHLQPRRQFKIITMGAGHCGY